MTCILSVPSLYEFKDDSDVRNSLYMEYGLNLTNADLDFTGLNEKGQDCERNINTSRRVADFFLGSPACTPKVAGGSDRARVGVAMCKDVNEEKRRHNLDNENGINKGQYSKTEDLNMCNRLTDQAKKEIIGIADIKIGTKRKPCWEDIFVPPAKRISPFLNTPRERREERKKIVRISIKKLKQLEDPEKFLRRTVLMNNTMKRLQTELRQEKSSSNKYSFQEDCFSKYPRSSAMCGVLSNRCLSNSYLFDDPFLSGEHEKITDDMTETLVNSVLNYTSSDEP